MDPRRWATDYNKDIPLEVQVEEWEAEHNPPPDLPSRMPPHGREFERRLDAFAEMIGKAVGEILKEDVHTKIDALEKRIAELEAKQLTLTGPWKQALIPYKEQSVNHGGSLWIARAHYGITPKASRTAATVDSNVL